MSRINLAKSAHPFSAIRRGDLARILAESRIPLDRAKSLTIAADHFNDIADELAMLPKYDSSEIVWNRDIAQACIRAL